MIKIRFANQDATPCAEAANGFESFFDQAFADSSPLNVRQHGNWSKREPSAILSLRHFTLPPY